MPTKLCRWGNSTGLRLGRHVLEGAGLRVGDEVYVRVLDSGDVLIRPVQAGDAGTGSTASATQKMSDEEILAGW